MHILSCTPENAYEIGSIVIVLILQKRELTKYLSLASPVLWKSLGWSWAHLARDVVKGGYWGEEQQF